MVPIGDPTGCHHLHLIPASTSFGSTRLQTARSDFIRLHPTSSGPNRPLPTSSGSNRHQLHPQPASSNSGLIRNRRPYATIVRSHHPFNPVLHWTQTFAELFIQFTHIYLNSPIFRAATPRFDTILRSSFCHN